MPDSVRPPRYLPDLDTRHNLGVRVVMSAAEEIAKAKGQHVTAIIGPRERSGR
jgi:hypothetical protein